MLGKQSVYATTCFAGNFIGADYGIDQDLTGQLPDDWRAFNARYIPRFLEKNPGKSRVGAGLACGALWTLAKGIKAGDIVLCPDGTGRYRVGEVNGEYRYAETEGETSSFSGPSCRGLVAPGRASQRRMAPHFRLQSSARRRIGTGSLG